MALMLFNAKDIFSNSAYLSIYDILLWRGCIMVLVLQAYAFKAKINHFKMTRQEWLLMLGRTISGLGGIVCHFIALKYISLGKAILIQSTEPMV